MSQFVFAALAPFVVGAAARSAAVASCRRRVPALGFLILVATGAVAWALGGGPGPAGLPVAEQAMVLALPWLVLAWLDVAFSATGRIAPDLAWPLHVGAGVAVGTSAVVAFSVAGSAGWATSPDAAEFWSTAVLNGAVAGAGSILVVYEYVSDRCPRRAPSVGRVGATLVPVVLHVALVTGLVPMAVVPAVGKALAIAVGVGIVGARWS